MTSEARARDLFVERFGPLPGVMVRVPGRVVLAGEHTDHSMLPVLAMAIDRAIFVAASESAEPGIQAVSAEFEGLARIEPGTHSAHGWTKQLEAALAEVGAGINRGARIAIASDLPAHGGLASSAALMIGVVAALNSLWKLGWDRNAISATAARAERRLGVETSGVEHTVITSGEAGMAVRIDMQPFAQRLTTMPTDWVLILASSGDVVGRADAVRRAYAERVVGTRMAAAMLAEMIGLDPNQTLILGDVADTDVIDLLAEELPVKQTIKEVARATEVLPARLGQLSHSQFETQVPVLVRGPALHVLLGGAAGCCPAGRHGGRRWPEGGGNLRRIAYEPARRFRVLNSGPEQPDQGDGQGRGMGREGYRQRFRRLRPGGDIPGSGGCGHRSCHRDRPAAPPSWFTRRTAANRLRFRALVQRFERRQGSIRSCRHCPGT